MTDEFATYDGAYVLGALSDDERRRFEDHVLVCDSCAESVRSLRGLPALLATVPPTVFEKEPEDPPANLLPVVLDRVRRSRRRRRLVFTVVAGVAAACLVLALVLAWPSSQTATSPPTPNPGRQVAMSAPAGEEVGVAASARVQTVRWGTRIDLSCRQVAGGTPYAGNAPPYQLVIVDRTGGTETLGTWNLPTGRDITFTGGTSVPVERIKEVKITTLSGEDLLVGWP
jgi:hypothetical protein